MSSVVGCVYGSVCECECGLGVTMSPSSCGAVAAMRGALRSGSGARRSEEEWAECGGEGVVRRRQERHAIGHAHAHAIAEAGEPGGEAGAGGGRPSVVSTATANGLQRHTDRGSAHRSSSSAELWADDAQRGRRAEGEGVGEGEVVGVRGLEVPMQQLFLAPCQQHPIRTS